MSGGQTVEMVCPPHLAYGKAGKHAKGSDVEVPPDTDLTFSLEVLGCEERFETLKEKMVAKDIKLPRMSTDPPSNHTSSPAPAKSTGTKKIVVDKDWDYMNHDMFFYRSLEEDEAWYNWCKEKYETLEPKINALDRGNISDAEIMTYMVGWKKR